MENLNNKKEETVTIYQLHAMSGEYEDYCDRIVGSWFKREKAEKEKERLDKLEAEYMKCQNCVLIYCEDDCDNNCEECCKPKNRILKAKKYCDKFEPIEIDGSEIIHCKNKAFHPDEITYRIEEVEVIK